MKKSHEQMSTADLGTELNFIQQMKNFLESKLMMLSQQKHQDDIKVMTQISNAKKDLAAANKLYNTLFDEMLYRLYKNHGVTFNEFKKK